MTTILIICIVHWYASLFFQTVYHHRYMSHSMFTMNKWWGKIFYLGTYVCQGSSYLSPRAYAGMHRMHHAYSDTPKDPHSPKYFKTVLHMMWSTKKRFMEIRRHENELPEEDKKFMKDLPRDGWFERNIANSIGSRIVFGIVYAVPYILYADHWWLWLFLLAQLVIAPIQGAIVNWCGHTYGYRNFKTGDDSRNTLVWDIFLLGELFQNNHHYASSRAKFSAGIWEFDPVYPILKACNALGIIRLKNSV